MLMTICGVCGRKIPQGTTCPCQRARHKTYNREHRDSRANDFYHSTQWEHMRQVIIARAHGADELVMSEQGRLIAGNVVHHIETLQDAPGKRLNAGNLILLSAKTHAAVHAAYDKSDKDKQAMIERLHRALAR